MQKITQEFVKSLTRSDVLSLDIATKCGFHSIYDSGTVKFPNNDKAPKYLGEDYGQHKNFREWLVKQILDHSFKVLAIEDVIYGHFMDFRKLCEFRGIVFEVAESFDIPIVSFKPSDIKKHATGNGNADKKKMIEYAQKRYHLDPVDDNEADAIHIWFYFVHRYKL